MLLVTAAHGGRGRGGGGRGAAVGPRGGTARGGGYGYSGARGSYGASYGSAHGPYGGAAAGGARGGSYTTQRGTTITHGAAGGAAVGPGGTVAAGGARGTQITTPSGRTATTGSRGGAVSGPGGRTVAGGSRGGVASGPGGTVAGGSRAGAVVGPHGGVAGSRTAVGARNYSTDMGLARYTSRGVAAGGAYHSTRYVSRSTFTAQAGYVRTGWAHTSCFTAGWYRNYPAAWRAARWAVASVWAAPAYNTVATWCALPPEPLYYDYGTTVVFRDDEVYRDGVETVSVERYAEQAINLANSGRKAEPEETDEWQPLGVFAIVQGDEKSSNQVFQLAVNKARVIRGNYYDAVADTVLPVTGKVGKKSQRAVWTIGKKKNTVYEAGLANLSGEAAPLLVHFGKKRTQQWGLVRIEEPQEKE
jgi:hypothetical protein